MSRFRKTKKRLAQRLAGAGADRAVAHDKGAEMRKRRLHLLFLAAAVLASAIVLAGGPAASAQSQVPGQLAGVWCLPLSSGDYQCLLLADSRFEFFVNNPSGGFASGEVSVSGNTITFYSSNVCSGTGTYQWSLSDGGLTFVPLSSDPCRRAQYLPAGTWTRP